VNEKSHDEGIASHIDPESCGATRKGGIEALTGEHMGRVSSRVKNLLRDVDAVRRSGRPHLAYRYREVCWDPARSKTPCTYGSTSHGNREFPFLPGATCLGRVGKSKHVADDERTGRTVSVFSEAPARICDKRAPSMLYEPFD
jgi:hypothetical protein